MEHLSTIWLFVWRYKWRYLAGFASLFLVDVCDMTLPLLIKVAIDDVAALDGVIPLVWIAGLYLLLVVVQGAFRYWWRIFFIGASHQIGKDCRHALFKKWTSLSQDYYDDAKTGDLMSKATNDLEAVRRMFGVGVLLLVDISMYVLVVPPMMIALSPTLALITLIPLPIVPLLVWKMGRIIHARFKNVQEIFSDMSAHAQENYAGINVIQSFAREEKEIDRFGKKNEDYIEENLNLARVQAAFHPALGLVTHIGIFLILLFGGLQVIEGKLSIGSFVAYQAYLQKMIWPMMALGWVITVFQRGLASLGRIEDVMAEEPTIQTPTEPVSHDDQLRGDVTFEDVSFAYEAEGPTVLEHVKLTVPAGTTLGITGAVGAGKSTLLELISRLLDPTEGAVRIDGVDVRDYELAFLRSRIGVVPQETFLFSETLGENIAFGRPGEAADEKVVRAAEKAQMMEFVDELPERFDTLLGERGVNLSGGQKQRSAIARALLADPDILVLDDCLSAVDAVTEEQIIRGLQEEMKERTAILVSHRISALRLADRIVVLDEGRIVEEGTHDELMALGGIYTRIAERQRLEEEMETL